MSIHKCLFLKMKNIFEFILGVLQFLSNPFVTIFLQNILYL